MSDEETLTTVFERIAERMYGADTSGADMATIQEWHFTHQIGIDQTAYEGILTEGEDFIEQTVDDPDDLQKLVAGFALYTLAEAREAIAPTPPDDPMFQ